MFQSIRATRLGALLLSFSMFTATLPVMAPMTGCTISDTQVQADGAAIVQAVNNIAAIEQAANPELASNLLTAAKSLQALTTNYSSGSATAIINEAAAALEVALAAIPQTAMIAPLIPIAVAAIDTLIASLKSPALSLSANVVGNPEAVANLKSYRAAGKGAIKKFPLRSAEGNFKAAWNKVCSEHRELSGAKL